MNISPSSLFGESRGLSPASTKVLGPEICCPSWKSFTLPADDMWQVDPPTFWIGKQWKSILIFRVLKVWHGSMRNMRWFSYTVYANFSKFMVVDTGKFHSGSHCLINLAVFVWSQYSTNWFYNAMQNSLLMTFSQALHNNLLPMNANHGTSKWLCNIIISSYCVYIICYIHTYVGRCTGNSIVYCILVHIE